MDIPLINSDKCSCSHNTYNHTCQTSDMISETITYDTLDTYNDNSVKIKYNEPNSDKN